MIGLRPAYGQQHGSAFVLGILHKVFQFSQFITTNTVGHLSEKRLEEIREFASYKAFRAKNGDFPVVDDDDEGLPF